MRAAGLPSAQTAQSLVFDSCATACVLDSWPCSSPPGLCEQENFRLHYLMSQRGLSQTLSEGSICTSRMFCNRVCLALTRQQPLWAAQ